MADYFTNISFELEATPAQRAALLEVQDMRWEQISETDLPLAVAALGITKEQFDAVFDCDEIDIGDTEFEEQGETLWVHASSPTLEPLAELIRLVIQPEKPIGFQWSNDCSRPCTDAYGGGCCAIFKDRVVFEATSIRLEALLDG